jgi:hypothetical protein
MPDPLVELKLEFAEQQLPALEQKLRVLIASDPVLTNLPLQDRENAAREGAAKMLLTIRSQSIAGLTR